MDLMQKLSETKVDTSLFWSTKTMGAAKESKREQMRRALLEEKFGINMEENAKILYEERRVRDPEELGLVELSQAAEGISEGVAERTDKVGESDQVAVEVPETKNIAVGSGLKRPLESDANGQPIVKKVKKSREARKERLMGIIETMERRKEQEVGDSSVDEEKEEEMDYESGGEDSDGEEEGWGGISDSPIAGADEIAEVNTVNKEVIPNGTYPNVLRNDESEEDEDGSDDGDDDGGEENESVPHLKRGRSEKANTFKEWALAQRRQVMNGGDPPGADTSMPDFLALGPGAIRVHVPRKREEDMTPPPELQVRSVEREVCSSQE